LFLFKVLTWKRARNQDFDFISVVGDDVLTMMVLRNEIHRMLRDELVFVFRRRPVADVDAGIPPPSIPMHPFSDQPDDQRMFNFTLC
jgi:hypothetical protein